MEDHVPKIEIDAAPLATGCGYPEPFDKPCLERSRRRLGDAAGLTQFGVNLLRIPPGGWSAQRHWHTAEDEFVWVVAGEVVLVTNDGERVLLPGDCAGFPAGAPNGHHLQNRSNADATVLEVGTRRPQEDACAYPDVDLLAPAQIEGYTHRDGTPYPPKRL
jgi:uncharacterized cupin superfamily protein